MRGAGVSLVAAVRAVYFDHVTVLGIALGGVGGFSGGRDVSAMRDARFSLRAE